MNFLLVIEIYKEDYSNYQLFPVNSYVHVFLIGICFQFPAGVSYFVLVINHSIWDELKFLLSLRVEI